MATLLERNVTRREFTAASITALFVGMAVTMIDCGGGGGGSMPTAPSPIPAAGGTSPIPSGNKTGIISENHGHEAVVTSAQLVAGGGVALGIQGAANHNHSLTLSSDQVAQVAAGTKVSAISSVTTADIDTGYGSAPLTHSHAVAFN